MLAGLARFEWILIELIVMGLLVWQMVSIRRAVRRDREAAAKAKQAAAEEPPPA